MHYLTCDEDYGVFQAPVCERTIAAGLNFGDFGIAHLCVEHTLDALHAVDFISRMHLPPCVHDGRSYG
jgi:hypothetical protein